MLDKLKGPGFIALAAMLWATDAPFRAPLSQRIDPTSIVLFDHLLGTAILFGVAMFRSGSELFKLRFVDWLLMLLIGAGGSALATVLFTASFQHLNPSVAILLQKLQPIFVVLVAYVALQERPEKSFYGWAGVAIMAAVALSVPHFQFRSMLHGVLALDLESQGVLYALGAAALWGVSTVAGKIVLQKHKPSVVTFWRYAFGLMGLLMLVSLSPTQHGVSWELFSPGVFRSLMYISLVSGLFSMMVYYQGLSRTPASVATFIELLYPVSAVLLNTWLLHAPLNTLQVFAGTVLVFSVLRISSRT